MSKKMRIGVIGCGDISGIYIRNLMSMFPNTEVVACAARTMSRVVATAERYGIPKAQSVDELLANPDVDIVLNLTIPAAHYAINKAALLAGKHVYSEKPLCLEVSEGKELVALAKEKGLYLGCAPDTVMGGGIQTCRELIDSGIIGKPLSATVVQQWHGPEHEHPNPAFLYQYGAGPIFDYGPYYMTALVTLLGPAKQVCGMAGKGFETRECTCPGPNDGLIFPVEVPTHVTGTILMENGAVATVISSFDRWTDVENQYEIYGTEGTLKVPNPERFGEPVYLLKKGEKTFELVPITGSYIDNSRGLGLSDMVSAIFEGRKPIASGETALHVLEIMHAFTKSAEEESFVNIESSCERPAPFK